MAKKATKKGVQTTPSTADKDLQLIDRSFEIMFESLYNSRPAVWLIVTMLLQANGGRISVPHNLTQKDVHSISVHSEGHNRVFELV